MFFNVQHPGENGTLAAPSSNWPSSQAGSGAPVRRPRSSTVVVTRKDGGEIGV